MAKFELGKLVMTKAIESKWSLLDPAFMQWCLICTGRHQGGDWGSLDEHDQRVNEEALIQGNRVFSAYENNGMPKIWIITEADRSCTTILFPEDY